jgi:hypothetical protein
LRPRAVSAFTLADRFHFLRGLERGLKQVRIAVILNAFQTGVMLIFALVTSISANVGGCQDASKDPHHELEGYADALSGFCRDKRASAAFFWLNFVAWAISLGLCLLTFARTRRNPRTGGFVPPGSQFPQDDEEAWNRPSYEAGYGPGEGAGEAQGYRPSHEYSAQGERLFDEPRGYATAGIRDPFEDPGYDSSAGQGRYGGVDDPYEAIRNVRRAVPYPACQTTVSRVLISRPLWLAVDGRPPQVATLAVPSSHARLFIVEIPLRTLHIPSFLLYRHFQPLHCNTSSILSQKGMRPGAWPASDLVFLSFLPFTRFPRCHP